MGDEYLYIFIEKVYKNIVLLKLEIFIIEITLNDN